MRLPRTVLRAAVLSVTCVCGPRIFAQLPGVPSPPPPASPEAPQTAAPQAAPAPAQRLRPSSLHQPSNLHQPLESSRASPSRRRSTLPRRLAARSSVFSTRPDGWTIKSAATHLDFEQRNSPPDREDQGPRLARQLKVVFDRQPPGSISRKCRPARTEDCGRWPTRELLKSLARSGAPTAT